MNKQESITEFVSYEESYIDFTNKFLKYKWGKWDKYTKKIIEILESRDDEERKMRYKAQHKLLDIRATNNRCWPIHKLAKNPNDIIQQQLQLNIILIDTLLSQNLSWLFKEKNTQINNFISAALYDTINNDTKVIL